MRTRKAKLSVWILLGLGLLACAREVPAPDPAGKRETELGEDAAREEERMAQEGTARERMKEAYERFESRQYGEATDAFLRAAEAAEAEEGTDLQAHALALAARCYSIRRMRDTGRPILERAASLADPGRPKTWGLIQLVRGIYEREDGRQAEAVRTFTELYDYCLQHELHAQAVDAAHHVAIAADPETQVLWAHKGIAAAEQGGFAPWLAVLWNNLGWTLDEMGRYEEALEALLKARQYHHETGGDHQKLVADWSVGHSYRMTGRLEEAAEILARTLEWAERRWKENPSPDTAEWVGQSLRELGELAVAEGDATRGLQLLEEAREKLREAGMPDWDAPGWSRLEERIAELHSP